ncbi:MAG: hypothetical protein MZU97_10065 [Bacillus subtilis]|nr:hypothetical protein [Bacillus subtilis]
MSQVDRGDGAEVVRDDAGFIGIEPVGGTRAADWPKPHVPAVVVVGTVSEVVDHHRFGRRRAGGFDVPECRDE